MARFSGSFNEFYTWFDPTIRYWVTEDTRKRRHRRMKEGGCELCARVNVKLESHHPVKRKAFVRHALGVATDDVEFSVLDLELVWASIKEAHRKPGALLLLCHECHAKQP